MFGNPSVLAKCTVGRFRARPSARPARRSGPIVVRANYEGDPDYLLGTAPIYNVDPGGDEAARFAFIAPTLNIPIVIPVNVLSADDYRLRFTVSGHHPAGAAGLRRPQLLGLPRRPEAHSSNGSPKARPGKPAGCPGRRITVCIRHRAGSSMPKLPFTGNPSVCGDDCTTTLTVETYQSPGARSRQAISSTTKSPTATADLQTGRPGETDDRRVADSASGIDLIVKAPQPQSKAASPSQVRTVDPQPAARA